MKNYYKRKLTTNSFFEKDKTEYTNLKIYMNVKKRLISNHLFSGHSEFFIKCRGSQNPRRIFNNRVTK